MDPIDIERLTGWSCRTYQAEYREDEKEFYFVVVPQLVQYSGKGEVRPPGGNKKESRDETPKDTAHHEHFEETGFQALECEEVDSYAVRDKQSPGGLYGRFSFFVSRWKGELLQFKEGQQFNPLEDEADTMAPKWLSATKWAKVIPGQYMPAFKKVLEGLSLKSLEKARAVEPALKIIAERQKKYELEKAWAKRKEGRLQ